MSSARILVVDDEPHTRTFICDGLSALGIADDALGVSTADEAIAEISRHIPDLVITDVRMPGLNGLDLARYLRQTYPCVRMVLTGSVGSCSSSISVCSISAGSAARALRRNRRTRWWM
jgi:CheY-like chemotaxis protein